MDKNSIASLKGLLNSLKSDLDELSGKLSQGHKKLKEVTKETEEKYKKQLEQVEAAAKTRKNVDTYLRALKILIDEEDRKKKIADENIDLSKKNIDTIIAKIENVNSITTKSKQEDRNKIINEIKNDLPTLLQTLNEVHTNTNYIISRANANAYTLSKQPILQDAGISYPQPEKHLEGLQSHLGHPSLESSISNQISSYRDKVHKSRGRLTDEQSKGFSFIPEKLKAEEATRKQQELRSKFPNIQEKELGKSLEASFSFINAQKIPILKGTQTPENLKMRETIEGMFGVTAPDMIKYTRRANKEKNEVSGKELYEQHKKIRVGDRPDITSIGEEMREKFLQARNAKFNNPSALKDVSLEQALGTESSLEDVIANTAPGVNTSSLEDVIANTAPVINTTSGGSSGSSSPINTAPEINRGKTSSPGEVSDEMLKIIEEAVFNGAARAFSQFSNSPMSGPSEFSDSTIDKIGNTVYEAMKKALDYYSASPAFNMVLTGIEPSVIKLLKDELGGLPGGGGTGDMDKLAEEMRLSRESNEKLAKMSEARRKKAKAEATKNKKEREKEKQRIADPNSPESQAKKKKEAEAAEREQKRKDREQKRIDKENPNSPENLAKAAEEEEKRKKKEEDDEKKKLNAARQADPFRKRLRTIFKEGEQELSFLYAKLDSYVGWIKPFNSAILEARGSALETLRKGYETFDKEYANSGSAFKGMRESIKAMYSISPFTVIVAGLTTIGVLLGKTIFNAAQKLNTQIKEISAELGTSNRQSYEMFKNAMNAQTQFENLHASLRDVMDAQKGILGDSGILLRTNDKALSAIADNAKNIGLSVESAGAFYENLRMKGAGDTEANNVMTASLELADKRGFSPQSIVDDIAQNAEFASKYFSKITKDSKSAHQNLIETNIQVKNLGLNFQKAAKMTQHLLSFEQSITAEVEASVALGTHVDIGKARELLLQDDVAGAMTQMMNAIPGGYEGFQSQDFAQRQLSANLLGLEVSELERSLYLREKIKLSNSEDLELAMKHDDYLKKIAGTNDELYRTELNKVQAAERYNTSIEKLSVSFRYALAPVLEAVVPVVDLLADAINKLAGVVKSFVGGVTGANERGEKEGKGSAAPTMIKMGLMGAGGLLMANVMGGHVLKLLRGKLGGSIKGKIGEIVGKVRGGVDTLTGTLGTKTNPMYVISLGGGMDGFGGGGGGVGGGGAGGGGRFVNGKWRSQAVLDRAESMRNARNARIPRGKVSNYAKIAQFFSKMKPGSLGKLGTGLSLLTAGLEINDRQQQGQSNTQAVAAAGGGVAGSILGMKGGALVGAKLGTMIGSAIAGPLGGIAGAGIGAGIGGFAGGVAGYYAGGAIVDSQFKEGKKDPSYQTQPFQYQGMGLSATGSIYGGVNKPKPIGTPVETSMVDMTPTTFKTTSSGISEINPNYGTTSMARESVMVNTLSKSVEATALMKSVKEKNIEKEKVHKEMMEQQLKILESIREKINQPAVAFFTDEGRRQVINQSRVRNSH